MHQMNGEECYECKTLVQKKELVCRYMSGTFLDSETNYPTQEKETLALIWMFEKYQIYVID